MGFFSETMPLEFALVILAVGVVVSLIPLSTAVRSHKALHRILQSPPPWTALEMLARRIHALPRSRYGFHPEERALVAGHQDTTMGVPKFLVWVMLVPFLTAGAFFAGTLLVMFSTDDMISGGAAFQVLGIAVSIAAALTHFITRPTPTVTKGVVCWMDGSHFQGALLVTDMGGIPRRVSLRRRRVDWGQVDDMEVGDPEVWPMEVVTSPRGLVFSIPLGDIQAPDIHEPLQFDLWSLEVDGEKNGKAVLEFHPLHPPKHPIVDQMFRVSDAV
jgi:hypothetical protein